MARGAIRDVGKALQLPQEIIEEACNGLHLGQAVVIFILSNDFTLPVTTSFLNYIPETGKLGPVTDTIVDLPFGPLVRRVALFLLLSAVAHFTIASPGILNW